MKFRICILCVLLLTTSMSLSQPARVDLTKPLSLFFKTRFEQALPLFEQIVKTNTKDATARTWLAETYRRLGRNEDALTTARQALDLQPCSSFAHLVLAQASYPDNDTILVHVRQAIACDSTDPNAWLMMWGEAIRHADPGLRNRCLRKLVETGFFTKAALAYGRAELRTLPRNAVLVTNGDMDTYPAQAVQVAEGFRPDVAVIEREHFGIAWGCRFIRDHQNVPLPVPDAELDHMTDSVDAKGSVITKAARMFRGVLQEKLRGAFNRPIALAPTLEESFYSDYKNRFKFHGMFWLWQREGGAEVADTASLRQCLNGINPAEFTGPWASEKDRSPIRRFYTKGIVRVLSRMALVYAEALIESNRQIEAEKTLAWLETFEKTTELGPVSQEEIGRLRSLFR